MREYKFRAIKDNETHEFVFGYYYSCNQYHYIIDALGDTYCIRLETLDQYTGLKDKNGVEIYEGDIVSYTTKNAPDIDARFEVTFANGSFLQYNEEHKVQSDMYYDWNEVEVIGNVFDHPDLLTRKEME